MQVIVPVASYVTCMRYGCMGAWVHGYMGASARISAEEVDTK